MRLMRHAKRLARLAPHPARAWVAHVVMVRRYQGYLEQKLGTRLRRVDAGPVASKQVLGRTALHRPGDLAHKSLRSRFLASGMGTMLDFLRQAERAGFELEHATSAFELGCGGARVIRHLRTIEGLDLVGSDLDGASMNWCRDHLPGIEFRQNELEPPLTFARDDSFDLVFAYSVFTHIPVPLQALWIREIARVLRPGGYFVGTVLGEKMGEQLLDAEARKELAKTGHYTLEADDPRASESTRLARSWDVLQTEEHTLASFGRDLEVLAYKAAAQASVVARRPL